MRFPPFPRNFTENYDVLHVFFTSSPPPRFFAPCVTGLLRSGAAVHVLCLSTGDADGQGGVRPAELVRACVSLGVPPHRITCVDHPLMRDGLRNDWPASTVAAAVAEGADACRAAAVVTFDASGVSGHPNHAATCAGCRLLEPRLPVWHLRSVPAAAGKFCGPLLAPARALALSISSLLSTRARQQQRPRDVVFVASPPFAAAAGLRRHASQARWYRSVFVSLAATAYVNTLHRHGGG